MSGRRRERNRIRKYLKAFQKYSGRCYVKMFRIIRDLHNRNRCFFWKFFLRIVIFKYSGHRIQKLRLSEQEPVPHLYGFQLVDGAVDQIRIDYILKVGIGAVQREFGLTDIVQKLLSSGVMSRFSLFLLHLHLPSCSGKIGLLQV